MCLTVGSCIFLVSLKVFFPEPLDQSSVGEGKCIRSVERVEYPLRRISNWDGNCITPLLGNESLTTRSVREDSRFKIVRSLRSSLVRTRDRVDLACKWRRRWWCWDPRSGLSWLFRCRWNTKLALIRVGIRFVWRLRFVSTYPRRLIVDRHDVRSSYSEWKLEKGCVF